MRFFNPLQPSPIGLCDGQKKNPQPTSQVGALACYDSTYQLGTAPALLGQ
jgi:hypothetical protein